MFNVLTKEFSSSGNFLEIGTADYPWKAIRGRNNRTDNSGLLEFDTETRKSGNAATFGFGDRALRARNCRTEVYIQGKFIGMHRGLQWSLLQARSETRKIGQYQSYNITELGADSFKNCELRGDFPSITRYYLIGIDPDICHISTTSANYSLCAENPNMWYLSHDGVIKTEGDDDSSVKLITTEIGELVYFTSKLSGLDYIRAATEFDGMNIEDTKVSDFTDSTYPHAHSCREWVNWHFDDALESLELKNELKGNIKLRPWNAPIVKYSEQFKEAEAVSTVGHLRFARLADAIQTGIKPSSVVDLIQWHGIIPVLNVQKEVVIKMSGNYFSHLSNNACGKTCQHSNLVLTSGQYAIDVNTACFFYGKKYNYPHGKKAWILTALVNGEITIDSNFTDRIVPVGSTMVDHSTVMLEDDDFLNRI